MKTVVVGTLAVAALAASTAMADTVRLYDTGVGTTSGGSFRAETGARGTFETFCIERDEYLTYGALYYYKISGAAEDGGLGGGNPDPIDAITQNIYYGFRKGLLTITGTADEIVDAVQTAIWYEEGELIWGNVTAKGQALINHFSNPSNYLAGYDNVRVMNVYQNSNYTGNKQDQLIIVPLPHTSGLAGAGLLGLAAVRRRRA